MDSRRAVLLKPSRSISTPERLEKTYFSPHKTQTPRLLPLMLLGFHYCCDGATLVCRDGGVITYVSLAFRQV